MAGEKEDSFLGIRGNVVAGGVATTVIPRAFYTGFELRSKRIGFCEVSM